MLERSATGDEEGETWVYLWQGILTSKAGKSILIISSLASLPTFAMGLYHFPEGAHADMYKYQSKFLWQGEVDKQKYHMVKWRDICMRRTRGSGHHVSSSHEPAPDEQMDLIKDKYLKGRSFAHCSTTRG